MRLQLSVLGALLCAVGGPARAQTSFVSKVQVYVDNDHTQVVSPLVHAQADVSATTAVQAGYVADIVTSASIDVVTQASRTTIHDVRHQASLGAVQILGAFTARGGYVFSTENDYRSHNVALGLERRLAANDTTLAVGYALSLDAVGRSGDVHFGRDLAVHDVTLAWTQVVSPVLVVQATYGYGASRGYLASPYRFVPVRVTDAASPLYWIAETDPDTRDHHLLVLAASWHVGEDTALQVDDRVYTDTWGITSDTAQLRLLTGLTPGLELRLRLRGYLQSGASFYKPRYASVEPLMTIDRELSPLWSVSAGAKLTVRVHAGLELEAKVDGFYYRYPDFPLLPERLGANLGLGLAVTY